MNIDKALWVLLACLLVAAVVLAVAWSNTIADIGAYIEAAEVESRVGGN